MKWRHFIRFSKVLEKNFDVNGHSQFLDFKKIEIIEFLKTIQSVRYFQGTNFKNTSRNTWRPLVEVNFYVVKG